MCKSRPTTRYIPCDHVVEGPPRPSPFCLFGHLCAEAGHVDRVLSFSEDKENCPRCADHCPEEAAPAPAPVPKNEGPPQARRPAIQDVVLRNLEAELRGADASFEHCRSLLHHLLGLPWYVDRDRLVACFGRRVGGLYGARCEAELLGVARGRGCEGDLKAAFREGEKLRGLGRKSAAGAAEVTET